MYTQNNNNRKIPLLGHDTNALIFLIAANAIIFLIMMFTQLTYTLAYDSQAGDFYFQKQIVHWFVVSPDAKEDLIKPWSFLIYMFTHLSVMGIIGTALWLWAFGYILQDLAGNRKVIPIYLYGGWAGAACYLLANLLPASMHTNLLLMGGGPAVMAIAIATTTLAPGYKIYPLLGGGIPIWILTAIYVAFSLAASSGNSAVLFANIGGGLMGYVFIWQLQKGYDWSKWMYDLVNFIDGGLNPDKKAPSRKHMKVVKTINESSVNQQKLDDILDKINEKGIDHLSKEEREFLDNSSKH